MLTSIPAYWFKDTITTRRPTTSQDSGGGVISTYSDNLTSLPARICVSSGNQQSAQERINGVRFYKIYVSGAPDITDNDIIVFGSRTFDINAVRNPDEAGVFTVIDAVEAKPA